MTEKIIILDFGSQVTQLIGRRVREMNVYCEIHPFNKIPSIDSSVKGIILSGSPASVRDPQAPDIDLTPFKGKLPLLGICYGAQLMYGMGGKDLTLCAKCVRPSCLWPHKCGNLDDSHENIIKLYKEINAIPGIKKAFIGSGIRYDLFDKQFGMKYLREVIVNHTSGRLKVAPEHTEDQVLKLMRKPSFDLFYKLDEDFNRICHEEGLRYQLIPYFISSHPGCTESDMGSVSALNIYCGLQKDSLGVPVTIDLRLRPDQSARWKRLSTHKFNARVRASR